MKRLITTFGWILVGLTCFLGTAGASDQNCNKLYSDAFQAMKKDGACGKKAGAYAAALAKQRATCRQHSDNIRRCNMAKRHEAKACRGQRRTCKTVCKDYRAICKRQCTRGQRTCKKACPRGKRGKACRASCKRCVTSCNKRRRRCKKVCTKRSRPCLQAARRKAHDCRSAARSLPIFKTCQDGRAQTRKAFGSMVGQCGKYYTKAIWCTITSIVRNAKK